MSDQEVDPLREELDSWVGRSLNAGGPAVAPDEVNVPMIRHWVDALDDHNPVYLDSERAAASRFGGIVAPPAMLQTWTMGRPKLEGIAERGGAPDEMDPDNLIPFLDRAGYVATLATNSELEFVRYLHPGDIVSCDVVVESISPEKQTGIGRGYFITWVTTYTDQEGEIVGRQLFRILKFKPGVMGEGA